MCIYKKTDCELAKHWLNINIAGDFCKDRCGETPQAKLRMLKRLGVEFDADYDGSDLLVWVKAHGKRKGDEERKAEQAKRQAEAEAERQKLLSEMPGGFQLATNLLRHLRQIAAHYAKTSRIYRPESEVERIVKICRNCQKSTIDENNSLRCVKCGCHIEEVAGLNKLGKANYDALHCDLGKW